MPGQDFGLTLSKAVNLSFLVVPLPCLVSFEEDREMDRVTCRVLPAHKELGLVELCL